LPEIAYRLILNRNGRIMKENVTFGLWISLYVFLDGWNVRGICRKRPIQDLFLSSYLGHFLPFQSDGTGKLDPRHTGEKNKRE
jgi:hypothetical protein